MGLDTCWRTAPGGRGNGLSGLWEVGETADSILERILGEWGGCSDNVVVRQCVPKQNGWYVRGTRGGEFLAVDTGGLAGSGFARKVLGWCSLELAEAALRGARSVGEADSSPKMRQTSS